MAGWTEGEARARCGLSQCHTSGLVTCHVTPAHPVQVNKGWDMGCGQIKYTAHPVQVNKGRGMGCGQIHGMC